MSRPPTDVPQRLPWGLAWRIAFGQLVSWGILYYAFTVVVGPMHAATGWSRAFLSGGLTIGLLTWGTCAFPLGVWIHRRGAREAMAVAAGMGGLALVLMGLFPSPPLYLAAWVALGGAMAGALYDPAFAVVTTAFGPEYRRAITLVTLVGGLASTVFIPLAHVTVDLVGWRGALVALGVFEAAVVVPLHWFGLPQRAGAPLPAMVDARPVRVRLVASWMNIRREIGDPRFVGLILWFTAHAAAFTGLTFQVVPALQAMHVSSGTILAAIAMIGPMQVFGRLLLARAGGRFSTLDVGRWAMGTLVAATLLLICLPPTLTALAVFAALYGMGNGIMTILRGTAVAELFPRERYAELNGALSVPAVCAKAGAPLIFAWVWTVAGEPKAVFVGVLLLFALGLTGLVIARRAGAQCRNGAHAGELRSLKRQAADISPVTHGTTVKCRTKAAVAAP